MGTLYLTLATGGDPVRARGVNNGDGTASLSISGVDGLPSSLGQETKAGSLSVTGASDQRLATGADVYVAGDNPAAFDVDIANAPSRGAIVTADGTVVFET